MKTLLRYATKALKMLHLRAASLGCTLWTRLLLLANGISFGPHLHALGIPRINVSLGGKASIGSHFSLRTGTQWTEVGLTGSRILVGPHASLRIGDRVGASNVSIIAQQEVTIGNDVLIGGGVQIFDTNFHNTDPSLRLQGDPKDRVRTAPVHIQEGAFIGTNALICKGVTIGKNAIVAAGSVVVKDVPPNAIVGGNPATLLRP